MPIKKAGYSRNVKKLNQKPNLGKSDGRYGNIRYRGVGWRGNRMQVTYHPIRIRQFPAEAKKKRISYGTTVFTVVGEKKVRKFEYLPTTKPERQLGHPIALGDDIIVQLEFIPPKVLIEQAKTLLQNQRRLPSGDFETWFKQQIRFISRFYFKRIVEAVRAKIHSIVPKCTGRLQKGMVATLNRSVRDIGPLPHILKLNTMDNLNNPVYYANPVNNMPTEWLAHPPNDPLTRWIYHRSGPRLYHLFDPEAETDWYSKVLDFAQDFAKRNIGLVWKAIVAIFGVNLVSLGIYKNIQQNTKFE